MRGVGLICVMQLTSTSPSSQCFRGQNVLVKSTQDVPSFLITKNKDSDRCVDPGVLVTSKYDRSPR